MTKPTFAAALLIAVAAFATGASAATNHAASRHAETTTARSIDCVRAPDVGSFATAPYRMPPCLPGTLR
ncbi:hypothetical protein IC762_05115 [Bradyrhizobium genosp. L]|uniref:hypothetical protein n=1 Tax=Bradyrhizobium genosp. L TaxID=83637 RepID=UPI0018A29ECC|nr:hypothetical protein [Bradyrhizobium genosp. L]QPF85694.1 hypothetical protein IC762_05115 [Bradyrhizobium genosp. L]